MEIKLKKNKRKINLSEKKVLIEMLSCPGVTFSREEIGKISGIGQVRSIDVMITRLRQNLSQSKNLSIYKPEERVMVLWIE